MNEPVNIQNELLRFYQILFKRRIVIGSVIFLTLLLVFYINQKSIPTYRAMAKLVYEENKPVISELGLTPLSLRATIIQNFIEELKSYSLMQDVVFALPDSIRRSLLNNRNLPPDFTEEEYLIYKLLKNVDAKAVPKSDAIIIRADAHNPVAATIIANTAAAKLRERNKSEVNKERITIEKKLETIKQKVEALDRATKEFKEKHKIIHLTQESEEIYRRITEAEVVYNETTTLLESSEQRLVFVKDKLSKARSDLVPSITTVTSTWAQELKKKLLNLEVQRTALELQDYPDSHPKMQQLRNQIDEAKKNLRQETLKIASGENTIDPLSKIQNDLEEIAILEVDIHTLKAKSQGLKSILNNYNTILREIPKKEYELEQLEREKTNAVNIYTMLNQQLEEAQIQAENETNIRIIDPARVPKSAISPRKKLNLVIGFFVGIILSIFLVLVLEIFNLNIKTTDDVVTHIRLPVVGTIPRVKNLTPQQHYGITGDIPQKKRIDAEDLILLHNTNLPVIEAFRIMRTNIYSDHETSDNTKSILITSANPGEGKSFVAANLSASLSQLGRRVLLIDADLRRPVLFNTFKKPIKPGLIDILSVLSKESRIQPEYYDESKPKKNIRKRSIGNLISTVVEKTEYRNLFLLTSGSVPIKNPSETISSECMNHLLSNLKKYFDIIVLDMPPVNLVTDAVIMAQQTDEILFVIGAGVSKVHEINRAKELLLQGSNKGIKGVVLNRADWYSGYYFGYYYSNKRQNLLQFSRQKKEKVQA